MFVWSLKVLNGPMLWLFCVSLLHKNVIFIMYHCLCITLTDTHSAPQGWRWACVGPAKLDATPDSPASCHSCSSKGVGKTGRWLPHRRSDWWHGRSALCPRRGEEAGGLQSDSKRPVGRTVPPPESQAPGRRWEWLEGTFLQSLIRAETMTMSKRRSCECAHRL